MTVCAMPRTGPTILSLTGGDPPTIGEEFILRSSGEHYRVGRRELWCGIRNRLYIVGSGAENHLSRQSLRECDQSSSSRVQVRLQIQINPGRWLRAELA